MAGSVWILANSPTSSAQASVILRFCVYSVTMRRHEFQRPVERFKGLANEQVIFPQISMNSQTNFVCACVCAYVFVCQPRSHVLGFKVELIRNTFPLALASLGWLAAHSVCESVRMCVWEWDWLIIITMTQWHKGNWQQINVSFNFSYWILIECNSLLWYAHCVFVLWKHLTAKESTIE